MHTSYQTGRWQSSNPLRNFRNLKLRRQFSVSSIPYSPFRHKKNQRTGPATGSGPKRNLFFYARIRCASLRSKAHRAAAGVMRSLSTAS